MNFNGSKWFYLVGFFLILALPLLNLPPWFSPPDWGKTIVFRIILSILIFIFLLQFLSDRGRASGKFSNQKNVQKSAIAENWTNFSVKRNLGFWLLFSLLGIFFLATIFSLDRNFSLWGSPYRSGGFVNFAFYIFFAILALLILEESDWQKIWDFSILIGVLVSIIAIFQWRGLFKEIFISYGTRPPSTIGNPIFLAIYLLLLSFLTLSFGLKEKGGIKKFLYFLAFLFFLFVIIFVTITRAAIIGLVVGFLYFVFFYPFKNRSLSLVLKLALFGVLILGIYGFYYINTRPFPQFIQENKLLLGVTQRILIKDMLSDARVSGWKVSWQAMKARPILGYGPENFSIGFDKYYNPALPSIEEMPGEFISWWDRAHNFIFDIPITAGIPALIIYLSIFGVLFWQLQKLKTYPYKSVGIGINQRNDKSAQISTNQRSIIAHGIQATIIAYLVANFFSFDSFSSYLISFLLIGFSLRLISKNVEGDESSQHRFMPIKRIYTDILKWRGPILIFLFIFLIWFIWVFNIKPLKINSQINTVRYLVKNKKCPEAISEMEKILNQKSFLDSYLRLRYVDSLERCESKITGQTLEFITKKMALLKEIIEIQPYYTRSWISLGSQTNVLIESETSPETIENLKKEANYYFEKAHQLSPKRQEVFIEWIITDLLTGEYQKAKEKARKCIDLNEKLGDCWWQMALTNIYLGKEETAKEYIEIAKQKGYPINSEISLLEFAKASLQNENYLELINIYHELIKIKPKNPKYYIALAVLYKETGQIEEAKKEAIRVLEQFPEYYEEVEEFLKSFE